MTIFPEEVLEAIFLNLQPTFSEPYWETPTIENRQLYSTLATICRTSKACSRIATPILYHTLDFCSFKGDHSGDAETAGPKHTLLLLLRTFLLRPDLALQVQKLKAEQYEDGSPSSQKSSQRTSPILPHGSYEPIVQDMQLSTDVRLCLLRGLENELKDACIALLLFLCRNVQYAEYTVVRNVGLTLSKSVLLELEQTEHQHAFPKLRTLSIRQVIARDPDLLAPVRLSDLEPFLPCPSLRTIRVYSYYAVSQHAQRNLRCRGVKRLELEQGGFNKGGFTQLLRCFSHLRELKMSMLGTSICFQDGSRACVSPSVIGECLRADGTKIEKLHLVVGNSREEMEREGGFTAEMYLPREPAPLGDLRSLSRLRELVTTGPALLGYNFGKFNSIETPRLGASLVQVLPPSLETLRIVECHPTSEFMAALGEEPEDSLGMESLPWCLRSEILRLCCDPRFTRLRHVELERFGALEGAMESPGWKFKYVDDSVVLIRD